MKKMSRSNLVKIIINSGVGLGLVYLWTKFVNLTEIWQILSEARLEYLGLFILFYLISSLLRAYRLTILLHKENLHLKEATLIFFLSQFLSLMIPIRAGEITKGVYFSTQLQVPLAKALIWSFIDRFVDFWILFLLVGGLLIVVPTDLPSNLGIICIALAGLISVVTLFLIKYQILSINIIHLLSRLLIVRSIKRMFISVSTNILEGFQILRLSVGKFFLVMLTTVFAFLIDGAFWWMIWLAINHDIGLLKSQLGNLLMALSFLIPSAPGYVGSTEASGLAIFAGVLGVDPNLASAATVAFHLTIMSILLILGLGSIYLLKFDLSLIWKQLRKR